MAPPHAARILKCIVVSVPRGSVPARSDAPEPPSFDTSVPLTLLLRGLIRLRRVGVVVPAWAALGKSTRMVESLAVTQSVIGGATLEQ